MEIIPAIDLIDGKCVRLTQGDYAQKKIYNENPVEVAKEFESAGIRRLHLVDLDGAKAGKIINHHVLESISSTTKLVIDFGGGIKTQEDIERVFNSGATIATIGSLAVKNKDLLLSWVKKHGSEKFLIGADVKNEKIAIGGWMEETQLNVFDFVRGYVESGIKNIFCTDISKDGLLDGPATELYKKIITAIPTINLIASGGVASLSDLEKLMKAGCSGVIIGKALYENRIALSELKQFIQ